MSKTKVKSGKSTTKKYTVHVSAFEGREGSGRFYWYTKPENADKSFEEDKAFIGRKKKPDADAFRFDLKVGYDPEVAANGEKITEQLETRFWSLGDGFDYDKLKLIRRFPKKA